MDEDAKMALGMVLSALGGILERNNICTTMDLANTLGNLDTSKNSWRLTA